MVVLSFSNWYHSVDCRAHCYAPAQLPRTPSAMHRCISNFFSSSFGYASTTYRDHITRSALQLIQPTRPHFLDFDEPLGLLPAATVVALWIAPPRPQRSTQACLSLSKCFSLPFLPWLGRRPFRPALEAQRHRSSQDTLPLLCQWPGLRRWSRPRRRKRKRQQNPPKRIKSRAAKDGR